VFTFEVDSARFAVLASGIGSRNERDPILLGPLDSGSRIVDINYARRGDLLLLMSQHQGLLPTRGQIDAFDRRTLERRWTAPIPSIAIGPALVTDTLVFVTGRGLVGAIDVATGKYRWRHDGLADPSANRFTGFATPVVRAGEIVFLEASADGRQADSIRVDRPSGVIVGASRPILGARATSAAMSPAGALRLPWPTDQDAYQLGVEYSDAELATIPRCSEMVPVLTSDSIGPLRAGVSIADLLAKCAEALLLWEWSEAPVPKPTALVRVANAPVSITLEDTLATSRAQRIAVVDRSLRTRAGVGPGSSFGDLRAAYGPPAAVVVEDCALVARFEKEPGLAWALMLPRGLTGCERVTEFARRGALAPIPPEARVMRVTLTPKP
jgi:hypothetical protein